MNRMTTSPRRWTRRPTVTLSDIAVWAFFVLLTAAILLSLCIPITLVTP